MTVSGGHYVITGGTGGIGQAVAEMLRQRGAQVTLWDIDATALSALQTPGTHTATVDVTDMAQVQAAMTDAAGRTDGLDGVIHCAGILHTGMFASMSPDQMQRMVNVNLFGSMTVAQAAIPHLTARRGSLVLLASISAYYGAPEFAAYAATKAGVLNLAESLRLELEDDEIHVCVVCPYFVDTNMVRQGNMDASLFRAIGFEHTPQQVAEAILRAMQRKQFMVRPSMRVRQVFILSRYLNFAMHGLIRRTWRGAKRKLSGS